MSNNLALKLREGTSHSHTLAENTAFTKCFLKGIVEKEPFRKLLADFYFLYSTLEEELERHHNHPVISNIYFPELNRKQNLAADLEYYYGENWAQEISPSAAGQTYVARIREVSNSDPALLVAHSYVRYMGDLSGGQSLKNIARSALALPADQGTQFYEFEQIPTAEARREFKGKYRDGLNALPIDEALENKIVEEANTAFTLNRDVVHELEDDVKAAIGDHVFDLITRQEIPGATEHHHHHGHGQHPENLVRAE
ncbi:heme oxygenase (biliverdin-producing) [Crocosphaera sp. UHCC 0190]|uniref:biliverdin-producing heme oxygenase n=1 Tax=Crocosphaera sp. UHCC 0190 TaxID=3110246 RepID=UPI002B1EE5E6|nr:heme oxygenase (biliverdin-producing) [Crocosphaera sp. UHCC 0190]MEA5509980.1 heme oxygenase (biliverdin-producing) [Crocosphaera sp. UHCC 0190]